MTTETREFQAEVKRLLDLMIHSLYSNKDVFLRELVSNASDALDRRRFEGLTDPHIAADGELAIRLVADPEARTLAIEDNGIGMTRDELVLHLGTIAKSGTLDYLRRLEASETAAPELIGQFGVGFYSCFMVADRVEVVSRRAGEERASRWSTDGSGTYTIEDAERDGAGTTITLHLLPADREDGRADYSDERELRRIVRRYSDFVAYPIRLRVLRAGEAPSADASDAPLNSMKAIWMQPAAEVSEEAYHEFYTHITHDHRPPLLHVATALEGTFEARALLYVPSVAPFDLYHREMARKGVQLYVRRVFIMDECRDLLPEYLRFVKGVVDAEDLSLNVSREMLQQSRPIQVIRNHLVKKVLEELRKLMESEPERYLGFWAQFGPVLKEGLLAFDERRERILDLVYAPSTRDDAALTSLAAYVERMPAGQELIYYAVGPSRATLSRSPHLEAFREKGIEVLLFSDPVDEVWLEQRPPEYRGKRFRSVLHGELALDPAAGAEQQAQARGPEQAEEWQGLLQRLRTVLQDDVEEVRLSSRLTSSPACLVRHEGELSAPLRAMLRQAGQDVPEQKPALELNPGHALLRRLREVFAANRDDPRLAAQARLLYAQAVLAEGGPLSDPAAFNAQLSELMVGALG